MRHSTAALGDIVTVTVGPEKKQYKIYKDLICYHSEYFRKAFNGPWKEAEEGVVLDDVEVGVFNIFVDWLYTQTIPRQTEEWARISGMIDPTDKHAGWKVDLHRLKACVFGDRFFAPNFHDAVHNLFVDELVAQKGGAWYEYVIFAFTNLPEDNEILKLLVDKQCASWSPSQDDNNDEKSLHPQLPHSFLLRYMLSHAEVRSNLVASGKLEACSYHRHASDEERKQCQKPKDTDTYRAR